MMQATAFTAPAPLSQDHEVSGFRSGETALDAWLVERALKNERASASRTYVICQARKVVGYYCLAAGAIAHGVAPKKLTRNMPDPIPVLVLGRLAIDQRWQNQGLGKDLLRDAVRRTLHASEIAGVAALLVHAISDQAKRFYLSRGLQQSPIQPMTLLLSVTDARKVISEE
jgi:GNAT superfamily N-acetyltransferase